MFLGFSQVIGDHLGAHFLRGDLRHPAQFLFGFGGVTQQGLDFGGAEVAGVDFDDCLLVPVTHFANALAFPAQLHAQGCGGVFGALKADCHMALDTQVVDFIGLGFLHDAHQVAGIGEVTVVQLEVGVVNVRVLVDVVYPLCVERAGPALDAVHDVAFFQKKFSQVGAVLAGDAGDQSNLGLLCSAEGRVLSAECGHGE